MVSTMGTSPALATSTSFWEDEQKKRALTKAMQTGLMMPKFLATILLMLLFGFIGSSIAPKKPAVPVASIAAVGFLALGRLHKW